MKQQNKKKRRRSKASKNDGVCNSEAAAPCNDEDVLRRILEPFPCVSVEEAASAYKEANGDLNKAAEILGRLVESREDRSTTSSSVSSWNAGSSSCMSTPEEVFGEDHKAQCAVRQKSKMKKAVASAGTVSTVLGKDYVSSTPKKNSSRLKGFNVESYSSEEDIEQFLCSMLGEESQLSFSVVRDVLCQCGYDADKRPQWNNPNRQTPEKRLCCFLNQMTISLTESLILLPRREVIFKKIWGMHAYDNVKQRIGWVKSNCASPKNL